MPDFRFWPWIIERCSSGCVLVFHDIAAGPFCAFISDLGIQRIVPLDELLLRARNRMPTTGLFAITVDDGVGATVRDLSAVMIARSWPGTFYLPTDGVESGAPLPFHWWRALRPHLPRQILALPSGPLDLRPPHAIDRLFLRLQRLWHTCHPSVYQPLIGELVQFTVRHSGIPLESLQPPAPISWPEVEALSRSDAIRFESHGATHTAMSALSESSLIREMQHSRDLISLHTGRPCRHFAYPFGSPRSIGPSAPALAARFYDSASTMILGSVDSADPFLLPRIPIYPENSIAKARAKLLVKGRRFHLGAHSPLPAAGAGVYLPHDNGSRGAS